jgi:hypothetical protein
MCILILVLALPGYGADPSVNPGVAPLADLIRDLKATALDATALRELGGTRGFREYPRNPVLKPGALGSWDAGALGSMTVVKVGSVFHLYYEAWDRVLRLGNSWYDRMADAYGKPTRAERQAAFRKIDDDIRKLTAAAKDWKSLSLAMLIDRRAAVSERIGQMFVALLLPAVSTVSNVENRGAMKFDLTKLAFALAAYRADRGVYPARLVDLVSKYVAKVPGDIFSAAELRYRLEGGGYLLYSVGVNGKDDGGKGMDDRKEGEDWDDIAVRIPATTPQKQ